MCSSTEVYLMLTGKIWEFGYDQSSKPRSSSQNGLPHCPSRDRFGASRYLPIFSIKWPVWNRWKISGRVKPWVLNLLNPTTTYLWGLWGCIVQTIFGTIGAALRPHRYPFKAVLSRSLFFGGSVCESTSDDDESMGSPMDWPIDVVPFFVQRFFGRPLNHSNGHGISLGFPGWSRFHAWIKVVEGLGWVVQTTVVYHGEKPCFDHGVWNVYGSVFQRCTYPKNLPIKRCN